MRVSGEIGKNFLFANVCTDMVKGQQIPMFHIYIHNITFASTKSYILYQTLALIKICHLKVLYEA